MAETGIYRYRRPDHVLVAGDRQYEFIFRGSIEGEYIKVEKLISIVNGYGISKDRLTAPYSWYSEYCTPEYSLSMPEV